MDSYEKMAILVLSLFLIPVGYVVFWIVSIIRSPKLPLLPPMECESFVRGEQKLTISYKKGSRPDQGIIDGIKSNIAQYEAMIRAYVKKTEGQADVDFEDGMKLEGISFPIYDDELSEYDFSFDYGYGDYSDMSVEVYFKDGKVQSLESGD